MRRILSGPKRRRASRSSPWILITIAALVLAGCAQGARSGLGGSALGPTVEARPAAATAGESVRRRSQLLREEQRIGAQLHPQILRRFGGAFEDRALTAYVREIGLRLARATERPASHWTFTILDTPIVNAGALPGGYIYVTRGLLALAGDEAQLAGVIGHEIAHVIARHEFQRLIQADAFRRELRSEAARATDEDRAANVIANTIRAGARLAAFSRDQELEADLIGVRLLADAGYHPDGQGEMLARLELYSAVERRLTGRAASRGFFSTHPRTEDRRAAAISAAEAIAGPRRSGRRNRTAYLAAIDGLPYVPIGLNTGPRGARVDVVTPARGVTIEALAARSGARAQDRAAAAAMIRALNGLVRGEQPRPGQSVKILVAR